jgi:hypothetical protein
MGFYDDTEKYPGPAWDSIRALTKALEDGGYEVAPSKLRQGCIFIVPDDPNYVLTDADYEAAYADIQRQHENEARGVEAFLRFVMEG